VAAALFLAIGCGGVTTEITVSEHNAETLAAAGLDAVRMIEDVSGMIDRFSESFFDPAERVVLCDTGDVALSVHDVGAEGLSTGDDATVDFNGCVVALDDGPLTLDGSLYLRAEDMTRPRSSSRTRRSSSTATSRPPCRAPMASRSSPTSAATRSAPSRRRATGSSRVR
jgi:hypothetical protein